MIELVKRAPDNPFTDDEAICGEILRKIAEKHAATRKET
jgi:hypothetical protein